MNLQTNQHRLDLYRHPKTLESRRAGCATSNVAQNIFNLDANFASSKEITFVAGHRF